MADLNFFFFQHLKETYSALCKVLIGFLVIFLIINFIMAAKMCEVVKREMSMKNKIDEFGWTELHAAKVPLGMLKILFNSITCKCEENLINFHCACIISNCYEAPVVIILTKALILLFLIAALQAVTTCVLYLPTRRRDAFWMTRLTCLRQDTSSV